MVRSVIAMRRNTGRVVAAALGALDAGHGLQERVVAGPVLIGAAGAEGRSADEDDARVQGRDRLVVDVQAFDDAGAEVLDDHVGPLRGQLLEDCLALGLLQVDAHSALATVVAEEAAGEVAAGLAAWRLHLHDVDAGVGEHGAAVGAGDDLRQVDNVQAFEGAAHVTAPAARRAVISAPEKPSSRQMASLCWPGNGAGPGWAAGASSKTIAGPICSMGPSTGSS